MAQSLAAIAVLASMSSEARESVLNRGHMSVHSFMQDCSSLFSFADSNHSRPRQQSSFYHFNSYHNHDNQTSHRPYSSNHGNSHSHSNHHYRPQTNYHPPHSESSHHPPYVVSCSNNPCKSLVPLTLPTLSFDGITKDKFREMLMRFLRHLPLFGNLLRK